MNTKSKDFEGYLGQEKGFWQRHHKRYRDSILAVGRGNASPSVNEREYALAIAQFISMVELDFADEDLSEMSVLDLGYGQGHYARACDELGFGTYLGLDFAAPPPRFHKLGYRFENRDISDPSAIPDKRYSLVYCLDVLFHVVDDEKFVSALNNIKRSASGWVYITGLFNTYVAKPYVKHRPMSVFADVLGEPISVSNWRDNRIARFFVDRKD